jgi:hypothetical protein
MKPWEHPIRKIQILEDESAPRRDRAEAAYGIALWARMHAVEGSNLVKLLARIVDYWQTLCRAEEEPSWPLLRDRTKVARAFTLLGHGLPEGQRFFRNIPRVTDAEGPHPSKEGTIIRGSFNYMYRSIYEFHWEYPIEGFGVRKDLISVIEADDTRTPMFDWLQRQDLVVWCSGCGLEVTYEISKNCPARALMAKDSLSRPARPSGDHSLD